MDANDYGHLAYLVLLGLVIGGYFFLAGRRNLGRTAQQAGVWALLFVGAVAVAGLWPGLRDTVRPRQSYVGEGLIEVPRDVDGHYRLTLDIDGTNVPFVIDTGASDIVLSRDAARRIGIEPDRLAYMGRAYTANGTVPIASVVLDTVRLGDIVDRHVAASVNGGKMDMSLLGMTYLERFGRIEIANGRLRLER